MSVLAKKDRKLKEISLLTKLFISKIKRISFDTE